MHRRTADLQRTIQKRSVYARRNRAHLLLPFNLDLACCSLRSFRLCRLLLHMSLYIGYCCCQVGSLGSNGCLLDLLVLSSLRSRYMQHWHVSNSSHFKLSMLGAK